MFQRILKDLIIMIEPEYRGIECSLLPIVNADKPAKKALVMHSVYDPYPGYFVVFISFELTSELIA